MHSYVMLLLNVFLLEVSCFFFIVTFFAEMILHCQAEVLYELIEGCAGLRGDGSEIVLDLFCGTGTIGLTLAKKYFHSLASINMVSYEESWHVNIMFCLHCFLFFRARHVYGYEVVAQAIADAHRNAKLNGISNATFIQGDLNKIGENFGKDFPKPDIVISGNLPIKHLIYVILPKNSYCSMIGEMPVFSLFFCMRPQLCQVSYAHVQLCAL